MGRMVVKMMVVVNKVMVRMVVGKDTGSTGKIIARKNNVQQHGSGKDSDGYCCCCCLPRPFEEMG